MDKELIINKTEAYVRNELEGEPSGHDWWHIHRVTEVTKRIANKEKGDLFLCTMAALLHDIADEKLNESEEAGLEKVREWLISQEVDEASMEIILEIISTISFKGGHGPTLTRLEAKIVQDADRLDAIGAIGIARCFVYSGAKGRPMYDPNDAPREQMTKEEYRSNTGAAINHFYEKLLKLKELMNTKTGKEMAQARHEYMAGFLEQFYAEWDGKK
ncbi:MULTISPECIES: HD domain-containing protein [Bacillaceae]|uniref:HD domain-containing protein n=1 Tax=Evansella alkalicola TaxID=745819 RepID=A0ABS6JUF6_9BACI|nr:MULTISPECIES: HD domain-containing protein [Bacillaceae]MBU9722207.1 HD domain-containing protein [Bacillus alkalicola]